MPPEEPSNNNTLGRATLNVLDHDDNDDLYEYLHRLPKVELHAHLNGCIREETLFALAAERGVTLSATYFHHHHRSSSSKQDGKDKTDHNDGLLYNTLPRSLTDCFAMFAEIPKAVNDLPALARITREALQDFAADGVVYLELRSTPKRLLYDYRHHDNNDDETANLAAKRDYVDTILQVMAEFEQQEEARYAQESTIMNNNNNNNNNHIRLPMKCRFLVSVDRSQSVEEAAEHVDLAIALSSQHHQRQSSNNSNNNKKLVVGMDLGGNPTKHDFSMFQAHLARARAAGLFVTIHCAEIPCHGDADKSGTAYREAKAILDFVPHRLGHALLLPPDLQHHLLKNNHKIPVETCPTSNVMTLELTRHENGSHLTLLQGLAQHGNLKQWLQANHPITIATDDPGVFGTTLTKELWLVAKTFGVDRDFFQRLALQSLDYAFCDAITKEEICARILEQIEFPMKEVTDQ